MTTQEFLFDTLKKFFNKNLNRKLNWYYICNEIYINRNLAHLSMVGDTDILEMLRLLRIGLYISEEPVGNFRCKSEIPEFVDYNFLVNVSCKEYTHNNLLDDNANNFQPELINAYKEKILALEKEIEKYKSISENKNQDKIVEKLSTENESFENDSNKKDSSDKENKFALKKKRTIDKDFKNKIKIFILETLIKYSDTQITIPFLIEEYISVFDKLPEKYDRTKFYAYINNTLHYFVLCGIIEKSNNEYYTNEQTEKTLKTLLPG